MEILSFKSTVIDISKNHFIIFGDPNINQNVMLKVLVILYYSGDTV